MAQKQEESPEQCYACLASEVDTTGRKQVTVQGRDIFIVKLRNKYYALDSICYHAGGPLFSGDIEDIAGHICVVCPWHHHRICVDSGDSIYQSIDPFNLSKPPEWKSRGKKQRPHEVIVREGKLFVTLSSSAVIYESDRYYKAEKTF